MSSQQFQVFFLRIRLLAIFYNKNTCVLEKFMYITIQIHFLIHGILFRSGEHRMTTGTVIIRSCMLLSSAVCTLAFFSADVRAAEYRKIAAIITEYRKLSHVDVVVGRLLDGYDSHNEQRGPLVGVFSMYTDQVPNSDINWALAEKHGFRIFPTVHDALTMGSRKLAFNGVVLIREHGNYPYNEKGQHLYYQKTLTFTDETVSHGFSL